MKLELTDDVRFAMRTLRPERLSLVEGHLSALQNWEKDQTVRQLSRPIAEKDVYLLEAADGYRIFFNKSLDTITVVDITTKATLDQFAKTK